MGLSNLNLEELYELRRECNSLIKGQEQTKDNELLDKLKSDADELTITDRVRDFYEKSSIEVFPFLYEGMRSVGTNLERMDYYAILISDKDTEKELQSIGIYSYSDFILRLGHALTLSDNKVELLKKIDDSKKIIGLYNFFSNFENVVNHQGAFYTLKYVSDTLNRILVGDEKDFELINKDMEIKKEILYGNFTELVSYLLEIRNSIENAKVSVCNQGLNRVRNKQNRALTYNEKRLIEAVAFGTTLDKIKEGNYEDSKGLIFVPYKKNNYRKK